jgi:hypothetical protein
MNKFTLTKTFEFYDEDLVDIISSAIYDIGYWSCIDNDTDVWHQTSNSMDEDSTFEDVFFEILDNGNAVCLIDVEDDEEVWEMTKEKLIHGMQLAINDGYWDGDMDSLDGAVGDIIFQYALFNEIVFG